MPAPGTEVGSWRHAAYAPLGWRGRLVRVVERVDRRAVQHLTPEQVVRAQLQGRPDNALVRWLLGRPDGVVVEQVQVPVRSGVRHAQVVRAPGVGPGAPLVLDVHGGGFAGGSPSDTLWRDALLSRAAGVVVVSSSYRLAPTHPWPAAVDDVTDVLTWVADHARDLGGDPDRLAVSGDSAGANLVTVAALAARDGGPRLRAQALIYPPTDFTHRYEAARKAVAQPVLGPRAMDAFSAMYVGHVPLDERDDPRLSPLLAPDLGGLPPTLVQLAEHDPLRAEGEAYAEALERAGVPVRATTYAGVPHGFISLPGLYPEARQAVAEVAQFLARHLA